MGSITPSGPQPPYPLHKSVKDKLHPDYVEFYNKHIIYRQQVHLQPISTSRASGILIPGGGPKLPVGSTKDYYIKRLINYGPHVPIRVFTPEGEAPEDGWPVMVYFHGGGWVLGNIETENTVCTHLCARGRCLVISVDYRLAPENPYPAAVEDSYESLHYISRHLGSLLPLNLSKICIGGSSAGGNLAAVLAQRHISNPIASLPPFLAQILIVPVTDNTALMSNNKSWKENELSPALPAQKMLWFRNHYLPSPYTHSDPEASPLLWQGDWEKLPKALVVVGELDVLRSEGEAFASKLSKGGVSVDLKVMKGMPHPFLAMDGALQQGRDAITAMVEYLNEIFVED